MSNKTKQLTTGYYLKYLLLYSIPGIGQIYALYCAFSEDNDLNKRNLARAYLICFAIFVILLSLGFTFQIGDYICK